MAIVNFAISEPLAKKINKVIKEWGFASKAEFFRFIAISFLERAEKRKMIEDEKLAYYGEKLEKFSNEKLANRKLSSVKDQLEDLL